VNPRPEGIKKVSKPARHKRPTVVSRTPAEPSLTPSVSDPVHEVVATRKVSSRAGRKRPKVLSGELRGPPLRNAIGKNLLRIRTELKLSQDEMGKRTGIDGGFIGAIERGDQNLTVDSLSNLAAAYGVPPDDLLRDRDTFAVSAETPSLAMLASITRAIDERVHRLLEQSGDVPIGRSVLASVAAAIYEALASIEQRREAEQSAKTAAKASFGPECR
jgi:transcriptional regulator with XRE-family HTH domain